MRPFENSQIEIASGTRGIPNHAMREADFVLDLLTFKVYKHRYGRREITPSEASEALNKYLDDPRARILFLVD